MSDPQDDPVKKMAADFLSNRSFASMHRDGELEIIALRELPHDLRGLPVDQLDQLLDAHVTVPADVARYLEGTARALEVAEVHSLEIAVEKYHGITEPFYISMTLTLSQSGRPWRYEPDAAPYLTGFILGKE